MYYEENFGITVITSFVIICYGFIIYLLLSIINIKVENILYVSILTAFCIILYDLSYRFCDEMYDLHLKQKFEKNKKNKKRSRTDEDDNICYDETFSSSDESKEEYESLMKKNKFHDY